MRDEKRQEQPLSDTEACCLRFLHCLEASPCGRLLGRICNGKVCWFLLLLYPITLWLAVVTCGVVFGDPEHPNIYFWISIGLASPLFCLPIYGMREIVRGWGGPYECCCRLDGRNFPCYGTRTRQSPLGNYDSIFSSLPFHGMGVRQIPPQQEGEAPSSLVAPTNPPTGCAQV